MGIVTSCVTLRRREWPSGGVHETRGFCSAPPPAGRPTENVVEPPGRTRQVHQQEAIFSAGWGRRGTGVGRVLSPGAQGGGCPASAPTRLPYAVPECFSSALPGGGGRRPGSLISPFMLLLFQIRHLHFLNFKSCGEKQPHSPALSRQHTEWNACGMMEIVREAFMQHSHRCHRLADLAVPLPAAWLWWSRTPV